MYDASRVKNRLIPDRDAAMGAADVSSHWLGTVPDRGCRVSRRPHGWKGRRGTMDVAVQGLQVRGRGEGRSSPSRTMPPSAGSARWNRARRRCPSPLRRPPPTGASSDRARGTSRRPRTRRRRRRRLSRRARTRTTTPAPASDVQPRRRRRNKAELAEAQAAAKREAGASPCATRWGGGALAEDPHLRRLEAAAKLEAEVERARAMAMGAGEGSNDGASAHPRNGSSNPRVVAHQPPARRTKPADETSTRARLTPPRPRPRRSRGSSTTPSSRTRPRAPGARRLPRRPLPSPRAPGARTSFPRGLKTSDLDALYRAVEREQRRFLAHVAEAARGVCASMGPRGMVRAARQWASRDVARRVDPKTGDAPGYVTPAPSPVAGPGCLTRSRW